MQVRLGALKVAVPILSKLSEERDMRAASAYKLSRLLKVFSKELDDFEAERVKLVQKYGEKKSGDDGETVVVTDPEKMKLFVAEFNDLVATEVDFQANKLKPEDFEGAHLSAQDFLALEFMIEEENAK